MLKIPPNILGPSVGRPQVIASQGPGVEWTTLALSRTTKLSHFACGCYWLSSTYLVLVGKSPDQHARGIHIDWYERNLIEEILPRNFNLLVD